jgi:spermidine/putrescine-binding protein
MAGALVSLMVLVAAYAFIAYCIAAAAAGATVWYERRYLPTIAGDE